METLKVVNPELLDILHEWMDFYDEHSFDNDLPLDERRFGDRGMEYYTSEEYLKEVQSKGLDHKGPPEFAKVCDFHNTHPRKRKQTRSRPHSCRGSTTLRQSRYMLSTLT